MPSKWWYYKYQLTPRNISALLFLSMRDFCLIENAVVPLQARQRTQYFRGNNRVLQSDIFKLEKESWECLFVKGIVNIKADDQYSTQWTGLVRMGSVHSVTFGCLAPQTYQRLCCKDLVERLWSNSYFLKTQAEFCSSLTKKFRGCEGRGD